MTTQSLVFDCTIGYERAYRKITLSPSDVKGKTSLLHLPISEIHTLVLDKLGLNRAEYGVHVTYFRTLIHTTIAELQQAKGRFTKSDAPIGSENAIPRLSFVALKRFR